MKNISKKNRSARHQASPVRCLARAFHSSESPDTAHVVDPATDSAGEIVGAQTWDEEFSMISFDTASVSVPSKP
jgi:hypothetical protein